MHEMTMEVALIIEGAMRDVANVSAIHSVDTKREAVIVAFTDGALKSQAYLIRVDRLGIPE